MKNLLLFFCSLIVTAAMQAQIIHVPEDYPTIQLGINAAVPGDTILVAEGTYYEQINFLGKKPLMVASRFLVDGDTSHISKTIIDGSQIPNSDSASVVYFISGEDTTSLLCGFSITGGRGTTNFDTTWGWARVGGGIWISASGAKIRNNIITRNRCEDFYLPGSSYTNSMGGGIATSIERDTLWIVIVDNGIDSNYVISNKTLGGCTGGGLAIINNCRISNNIIKNNVAKNLINTSYWAQGAGACIFSIFDSLNKVAIIQNNQFLNNSNNSNKAYGGGMKAAGGMHFTISNNTFIGNRVESNISITDCWGAGLEAGNFLPGSVISGNTFKNNYSEKTYGGLMLYSAFDNIEPVLVENNYFINNVAETYGGALGNDYCHIILQNNVFSGNHAGIRGGALYLNCSYSVTELYHHLAIILNNSFSENTATYGGAIYSYYAKPLIINSIFWGDSAANGPEIYLAATSDTVEIAYSTINPDFIHGNLNVGGNNINEDPLYTHPELLTIGDFSPCKNAGTEVYTCHCGDLNNCPHYDINGTTRPLNGGFDMGAWEEIMTGIPGRGIPNSELRIANWPNPVISSAIFSYFLQEPSSVTIQIFNSVGQIVDEPLKCWQQKGDQKIKWNSGSLPAGMYYYRIQAGKQLGSGKMVKN